MIDPCRTRRSAGRRSATTIGRTTPGCCTTRAASSRRSARTSRALRAATSDEHQEMDAAPDLPRGRRRLIDHRLEPEEIEVHVYRRRIARRDCEVTRVLHRHEARFWRGLRRRTHIAERAAPAAVADVVKLEDDAARIGDEQIARAAVR